MGNATRALVAVLLVGSLPVAGCGTPGGDTGTGIIHAEGPSGAGLIFVAWTIAGQPPSAASCASIDHLTLSLAYRNAGEVSIEPIPCALDRFRYGNLPVGPATLEVQATDTRGCVIGDGVSQVQVTADQPATPDPTVSIDPTGACR
jgi:hypothetical protein